MTVESRSFRFALPLVVLVALLALQRTGLAVERAQDSPGLIMADAPVLGSPSLSVSSNIALGAASNLFKDGDAFLWDDTSGNTAFGRLALSSVSGDASRNTAIGRGALQNMTIGAVYFLSSYNTAVGAHALYSNLSGPANTAVGADALLSNTSGDVNTAVGVSALRNNTEGYFNTATGGSALRNNEDGRENTANGWWALRENLDGVLNAAVGARALKSNTSGSSNTATGSGALYANTTGDRNTAIGQGALARNDTGERNIGIGYNAGVDLGFEVTDPTTSMSNNIYIGNRGLPDEEEKIRVGTVGTHSGTFVAGIHGETLAGSGEHIVCVDDAGQLGACGASSQTFKERVEDLGARSAGLLDLRPVSFRYRAGILGGPAEPRVGLIAEEVAPHFPELVVRDAQGRPFAVRYELLSVLLLDELKRQSGELAALRERLLALEANERPDRPSASSR